MHVARRPLLAERVAVAPAGRRLDPRRLHSSQQGDDDQQGVEAGRGEDQAAVGLEEAHGLLDQGVGVEQVLDALQADDHVEGPGTEREGAGQYRCDPAHRPPAGGERRREAHVDGHAQPGGGRVGQLTGDKAVTGAKIE